jgi:hypothetical protein
MTAQTQIILKYGLPDDIYKSRHCEIWDVQTEFPWFLKLEKPVKRIFINKDFKSKLKLAFTNLEKADLHKEIISFDGCYVDRSVRGRNMKSLHAWAMAIDLNASKEGLGRIGTAWSPRFIAIMKAAGLYWGGDWKGRKDPMHFALYNG